MASGTVNNNSIQSQFSQLHREREELQHATKLAESQMAKEVQAIAMLNDHQVKVMNEIRTAHSNLGTTTKKRQMFLKEIEALKGAIRDDREGVKELANELGHLEEAERNQKKAFVKQMDSLNEELDNELKRHEFEILQRMVTPRNVELLLERLKTQQKDGTDIQNSAELQNQLITGLRQLKDGAKKRDEAIVVKNRLEEELEKLRSHGLKSGSISGQGELAQLESLWMSRNGNAMKEGMSPYDADYSLAGATGSQYKQHQPTSMGLFYGADEAYD
eukprot:CAMPEP_0116017118 /NCGR_PEP_ID=MMETSP0321-20121206/7865_1 /TAXON_ID=163516 /ORGANISM="Leptocylindrus danicus var. danicus, Strain B650" /LENGTH=274 /DNA_ID=CAMNT_0003487265 /DNA_START=60 /DNA_END=884 /DNA_ORIENTATION=+